VDSHSSVTHSLTHSLTHCLAVTARSGLNMDKCGINVTHRVDDIACLNSVLILFCNVNGLEWKTIIIGYLLPIPSTHALTTVPSVCMHALINQVLHVRHSNIYYRTV
jgi:hypothetical protein